MGAQHVHYRVKEVLFWGRGEMHETKGNCFAFKCPELVKMCMKGVAVAPIAEETEGIVRETRDDD